jgi:hypothetical protein
MGKFSVSAKSGLLHDIYFTALIAGTPDGIMKKSMDIQGHLIGTTPSDGIKAICNNCNKGFKSMRAVTMHLKKTRHAVSFINYGIYDRKTGLRTNRTMKYIMGN